MLVREIITDAKTGEVTERWVEMPGVVTAEAQAVVDAQNKATETATKTNESTIGGQLDAALTANSLALNTLVAWRTTGPGAGTANLTAAQLSLALRTMADNQIASIRQRNALIRLIRRKLDSA